MQKVWKRLWNKYRTFKKKETSLIDINSIDSIAKDAIAKKAFPGCEILVAKDGNIIYEKSFGYYSYNNILPVNNNSIYDLASLTKIFATTLCVMKLYDEGEIKLNQKIEDFLPKLKGNKKGKITIKQLLTHTSGLVSFIPFYKSTLSDSGLNPNLYRDKYSDDYSIEVAPKIFLKTSYKDSLIKRINESPNLNHIYRYSDLNFIYLAMIIEKISGMSVDKYASKYFYQPMNLESISFKPLKEFSPSSIVPTEFDFSFRKQLLKGTVHDPTATMFGGVAGNAGLFSNAMNLYKLMQMLLNKGTYLGKKYIEEGTVKLFTSYQNSSRRGLGFDKPDKNLNKKFPYPAKSASLETFGHTGYTGTCAWADPKNNFIFIMLSNKVYPSNTSVFSNLEVRYKMLEAALSNKESNNQILK
ncbi:MAG: serine hydrolase [Ferruginibacter sp.]